MKVRNRVLLVIASPLVLVAFLAIAMTLPSVRMCVSFICGSSFDPGGAAVFGRHLFTPAQSVVVALGILACAFVLARGLLPARLRWTSLGMGVLVLAFVVAFTLPSLVVGAAPSVPCSSPGVQGPVPGRCDTGSPPVDTRIGGRSLVLLFGLTSLIVGRRADRRKP